MNFDPSLENTDANESQSRFRVILGTSYGISAVLHLVVIFCLTLVIFLAPSKETKATLITHREIRPELYDEKIERAMVKRPEVKLEKPVEKPVLDLEKETPVIVDKPKGESLDKSTTKAMNDNSVVDVFGPGGGAAGAYGDPSGLGKFVAEGGSPSSERAVDAGLRWLMRAQSPDGRWSAANWQHLEKHPNIGTNAGSDRYDVGVSGLALMAFIAHGNTHRSGQFKRTVNMGLRWLLDQQRQDGSLGFEGGEDIYNHAIAAMTLAEAFGVSRDFKLREKAQRAIDFCVQAQNPGQGWRYGVKPGDNDSSVTGWMVLALKSARSAGLVVPTETFDGARNWFERVTDRDGTAGYQQRGGGSSALEGNASRFEEVPCMTAVSALCRIILGEKSSSTGVKQAAKTLAATPPDWDKDGKKINFYYWYYGSYAMFQIGGSHWKAWNAKMQAALVTTQCKGGPEDGSWSPLGEWCLAGGRVYATAINVLTLEIYYRAERAQKSK
jgi:hypothetical protein